MNDQKKPDLLLWLDFETTGLDPEGGDVPLEVAVILTTPDGQELGSYHSLISAPHLGERLELMDDRCCAMHEASGLMVELLRSSAPSPEQVEAAIITRVGEWAEGPSRFILAGSSIHFDRRFLRRYFPLLSAGLFYRELDVSAVEMMLEWAGIPVPSRLADEEPAHRAMADVQYSLGLYRRMRSLVRAMANGDHLAVPTSEGGCRG